MLLRTLKPSHLWARLTMRFSMPFSLLLILFSASNNSFATESAYRETALRAALWLQSKAIKTPTGKTWPPDPLKSEDRSVILYNGSPGVVLFFAYLSKETGQKVWMEEAEQGGDYLLKILPEELPGYFPASLYSGVSGIGFVLEELHGLSGREKYRMGAQKCVALIRKLTENPENLTKNVTSDIISGTAGTGLFLLYATKRFDPSALELAKIMGDSLIKSAIREGDQWRWRMRPDYESLMPNFSHGTAGVVFFLARLYEETGHETYLNAALAGARRLKSLVKPDGLIHHNSVDGKDLYYLGWCHGPSGTSRTWLQLMRVTRDPQWMKLYETSINTLVSLDPSKHRTPGFWNNVGVCCGSVGVAQCALSGHEEKNNEAWLDLARNLTQDIIERASEEENGLMWVQAEHRVKPELLIAQTGLMQGAAGIGLLMLRMDAFQKGHSLGLRFPDEPQ